jgi:hypothetical protein
LEHCAREIAKLTIVGDDAVHRHHGRVAPHLDPLLERIGAGKSLAR